MSETTIAIAIGSVALFITFPFALYFVVRGARSGAPPIERPTQTDLTNMMILFQTMRDIVGQQKELAREFNKSVDAKVQLIRELIESGKAQREALQEAQRAITRLLGEAREELTALEREIGMLRGTPDWKGPAEVAGAAGDRESRAYTIPIPRAPERPAGPPGRFEVIAGQDADRDLIDSWAGLETEASARETKEEGPAPRESPEEARATRDAFRDLLNLGEGGEADAPAPTPSTRTNGRGALAPLQRRVYEYSDAGMSVQQISRELGIGKGEVRLILSLRADQEA